MRTGLFALALIAVMNLPASESLEAVPVASFSNVCVLTPHRIDEFLNCTLTRALIDGRPDIVNDFKEQVSVERTEFTL